MYTKKKIGIIHSSNLRTCFFPLIQTRFRKSLEPSINPNPDGPRRKTLKAAGTLVIGLSGGTSSITVLDLVAKTYFALPSTTTTTTDNGLGEGEKLKGGKEHPRNSADKGVWKGKAAVVYVEVCGAFPEVRFFNFWSSTYVLMTDSQNFSKKIGQRKFGLLSKVMLDHLLTSFLYAWKMLSILNGGFALVEQVFRNRRVLWVWI
jgi:hypothetical protein